jgi:energy-coupling factor transporter ATP-binding protein EcfA2
LRIDQVHIKGFRSLGNVDVKLTNYSSLIGKNDGGKSSFLYALNFLFDPNTTPLESDICKIEGYSSEVFIQATLIECFGHQDLAVNGEIKIRRIFQDSKWHWEVFGRVPSNEIIKKILADTLNRTQWNAATEVSDAIKAVVNPILHELTPSGRIPSTTWSEVISGLSDADLIEWETGWKNFDKERLFSLVTVVMLEADMRCEEELTDGGKSVFSQVGGLLLREATRGHSDMAEAIQQLNDVIERVATADEDGSWIIPEVNSFNQIMQEEISRFDGSVSALSTLVPPKVPALEFSVKIEISDQWVQGVGKMGHGLRRSVVFAMLRAHRRLRQGNTEITTGSAPSRVPLYLFLLEEPELYIHPQAEQRRMVELQELAIVSQTQIVLCTHSANFVDLRKYQGILRFERRDRNITQVRSWAGEALTDDSEKLLKMAYQLDVNRSAMLFADQVILVEGQTEKTMLPMLAKKLGCYTPDVEIVDCGGNQGIPTFQRLLEGFGIRYVAWMDRDVSKAKSEVSRVACARVHRAMSSALGKMIIVSEDWEDMTGVPGSNKPYNSWKFGNGLISVVAS